ncbi:MAG: Ig-like domain-containing protein [Granulosicoccus sp.]|nr:Ig-like domain-containing protein [Granulosicoccus sp.]
MVFVFEGDGTRTAEAFDGDANGAPLLTVTYTQSNSAPSVSASVDIPVIQLSDTAYLNATADDDGLPVEPGFLTHQWSVGNGPGGVTFGDPDSPSTSASFNVVGTYDLIHTVSDGQLSGQDTVTVTVEPTPQNQAPVVMAGDDQVIDIGEVMALNGFVDDDGLPDAGVPLIIEWTQVSGPGTAVVQDDDNVSTVVSYSEPGVYTFELSAYDGELLSTDEVVVTVVDFVASNSVTIPIINGNDDMEEFADGGPDLVSSDLEMTFDKSNQIVGMRFQAVPVPNGAIITAAHVQFTVDEVDSAPTDLIVQAEITDNSAPFADEMRNLSSRSLTLASVPWSPPAWTVRGQSGAPQQTPDLAGLIQEIVDQPGWTSGNALSILVEGNGVRTAESFDGDADSAARLVIEYQ